MADSSMFLVRLILTRAISSNGNSPKLWWNRGGVEKTCNISKMVQDGLKVKVTD